MDLEPETELSDNVYLGCTQRMTEPIPQLVREKNDLFRRITTSKIDIESTSAEGYLKQISEVEKEKPTRFWESD